MALLNINLNMQREVQTKDFLLVGATTLGGIIVAGAKIVVEKYIEDKKTK